MAAQGRFVHKAVARSNPGERRGQPGKIGDRLHRLAVPWGLARTVSLAAMVFRDDARFCGGLLHLYKVIARR